MSKIILKNISKSFGKNIILKNIDFEISQGEFMVIVGPSGCGKSTLLRIISGLEFPDEGDVIIDGKRENNIDPSKREIAMVFQNYALYPNMTVYENLAFSQRIRKKHKIEINQKVMESAEILKIENLLERKPAELSGGQRQRVALGRALVRKPKVFLFDEPLSNLDAKLRQEMRLEIKKLHNRLNTTMIYVTHDQTEAMTMADRICLMNSGKIEQIGTPQDLYNNPENIFVSTFIGMPPINLIEGEITFDNDRIFFINDTLKIDLNNHKNIKINNGQNRKIIIGIRPEDFFEVNSSEINDSKNIISCTVDLVENLGSIYIVHAHIGRNHISVSIKSETPKNPGDKIDLIINVQSLHFFDKN